MIESRKELRRRAVQLRDVPTEELVAKLSGPLSETEHAAIVRVLRSRGEEVPEASGEVTPDEVPQRVIRIEDLAGAGAFTKEKQRSGMGIAEGVCLAAGVLACSFLWMRAGWAVALAVGVAVMAVLYGAWCWLKKSWKELA